MKSILQKTFPNYREMYLNVDPNHITYYFEIILTSQSNTYHD